MELLLQTDELKKYYGNRPEVKAVDGVSLSICKGRSLGLIGESGSGKTTFGKLVSGLEKNTSGKIYFKGHEIENIKEKELRPLRKNLQMIFQSSSGVFDPSYTVGESILEVLGNYYKLSRSEYEDMITDVFRKVGLEPGLKDRYASQLSGGQCQRANIARALVLRPELVICDEPVSSLDYSIRKQILNLLNEMREEFQVTYLLITHDLSNIPYVCSEVAIMYQGKIVEKINRTDRLKEMAVHPYTKLLFASIPATDPRNRSIITGSLGQESSVTPAVRGCRFQNRCPYCFDRCKETEPLLREVDPGHWAACFLYNK